MDVLLVLIVVQFVGIILACIMMLFNTEEDTIKNSKNKEGNLATGTSQEDWPWLIQYFQDFPNSKLKEVFPQSYKGAISLKKYKELKRLKREGKINTKKYQKGLKKLQPHLPPIY